jgi:hypothetical protein
VAIQPFPVPIDIFTAETSYPDFTAGENLTPRSGVAIRTALLRHPNDATGYRIEFGVARSATSRTPSTYRASPTAT